MTKPEQPEFITLRSDALPELVDTILQCRGDVEGCTCDVNDQPSGNCRACYEDQLQRGKAAIIAAAVPPPERAIDPKFSIRGGQIVKVSSGELNRG